MRFLMTLLWMVVAVVIAIFSYRNWRDVTVDLWGPLLADIKLPLLMALMFLAGMIPTWLIMRARLWTVRRKLLVAERGPVSAPPPPSPPAADPEPDSAEG